MQIPPAAAEISPFSSADGGAAPQPWHPWKLTPQKVPTGYRLVYGDHRDKVLEATANSSASGLLHPLLPRPPEQILSWRWRNTQPLAQADNRDRHLEDAPLRVLVAFDGDHSQLPLQDQLAAEMAKLISGRPMPYATLMYIWGRQTPETVIVSPHTSRVRMIIVDSDDSPLNQWIEHRRDLVVDYEKAFGEAPGNVIGVGLLSDTDNTRSQARAWYGDLLLAPKAAP